MVKAGIVDPVKVTRSALENAASIASLLLTTECLVAELPEEEKPMPAMPPEAWEAWITNKPKKRLPSGSLFS